MIRVLMKVMIVVMLGFVSFCAEAQNYKLSQAYASAFCNDPFTAVCENNPDRNGGRERKTSQYTQSEIDAATQEVAAQFNIPKLATLTQKALSEYIAQQPEQRRLEIVWSLYQLGMDKLYDKYAEKGRVVFDRNIQLLTANFHQTIDRLFPGMANAIYNEEFHKRVDSISVLTPSAIKLRVLFNDPHAQVLQAAFIQGCGWFGDAQNAFAFGPLEGKRYLLVCPGWLYGSVQAGYSSITNFVNLLFVVSHEVGHHLDSGEYPNLFKKHLACVKTQYGSNLADPPKQLVSDYLKTFSIEDRVQSHAKEITADFWAAENLATYLTSINKESPLQPRIDIIRESFGALCDSQDEGIHPSGQVRAHLLGVNESVRSAMAQFCPYGYPRTYVPTCGSL